jgi:flagellar protein FlbT
MTLKISLRDGEKMVVNGAVLRAVGRTEMVIENQSALMRGREIMAPEDATTPARRLYFACMMAYINSEGLEQHQASILTLLRELMAALQSEEARATCASFAQRVALSDFYRALSDCRGLITYEAEILAKPENCRA